MPKIMLSAVKAVGYDKDSLALVVEEYRNALLAHRFIGNARPVPKEAWMEGLVRRVQFPVEDGKPDDFVADYEIIDDTPPPPTLQESKTALVMKVSQMESDALKAILPQGKLRLLNIRYSDAIGKPENQRNAADLAAMAAFEEWRLSCQAVDRHAAELMAEIDDLTETTIVGWKPRPFQV